MNVRQSIINKKIISYILGFFTLGILLIYCLRALYVRYNNHVTGEVADRQLVATMALAREFDENLLGVVDELSESGHFVSLLSPDRETLRSVLEGLFSEYRAPAESSADKGRNDVVSVRWFDAEGEEILTLPMNGDPLSPPPPFASPLESPGEAGPRSFRVEGPVRVPGGFRVIWIHLATVDPLSGRFTGTIAAEIDLEKLLRFTRRSIPGSADADLFIVDENGSVVYSGNHPEGLPSNIQEPEPSCLDCHGDFDLFQNTAGIPNGWGLWANPMHTELYAFSTIPVADRRWKIGLGLPEDTLGGLTGDYRFHFIASIVLTLALLGLMAGLLFDISRKQLEAEEQAHFLQQRTAFLRDMKEMDRRYIELVEQANDAIYILQGDRFVLVNKAFEELHGYTREELTSPDFDLMRIVAPEYRDYVVERGNRKRRGEELEPTYQFQVMRKNGEKVDVEVSVTYIRFDGKPAVQGVLRDISERKRQEKERELMLALSNTIRDSRGLEELAKNALDCVTKILRMGKGALYIHDDEKNELRLVAQRGIREMELIVQERYRLTEGDLGIAVQTALRREIVFVDEMASSPLLAYLPDRSTYQGKSFISLPLISQDVLLGVLQLARDRHDTNPQEDLTNLQQIANAIALGLHRRKIAAELVESERRLKHFFENSKDVTFITTVDGRTLYLNNSGIDLFGRPDEDQDRIDILRNWRSDISRDAYLERLRRDGFVRDLEMKYLCRDGEVHTFIESAVAILDESGEIAEIQGSMTDITSLKKAEEETRWKNAELEKANAELRELDRMKDNFIATISHELRTPLTSIKGSIDLLLKGLIGEVDEKKREILSICRRNSTRLIDLVNDLLEIQHLESGQTRLELRPLEIEALVPDLVERASHDCAKEGIRFKTRINPGKRDRVVLGDRGMISHALSNLLSNAVKFSERGTIAIEVAYHDGEVHLSVADEGAGIPDHLREKIFEKFTQADGSMTRKQGGTGLGLALTKTIVEKHGGRIWVESKTGGGTKFTFSLPCYPRDDEEAITD